VSTATEPIRQNEIYKSVSASVGEAIDDGSSSRYGGYRDRAERRRLREAWEKKNKNRRVEENPEAGSNVVLHKDSAWKEQWNQFKEENSVLQNLIGFKRTHYDESENPLVSGVRSATDWLSDTWSGMFAETEVAGVVRRFKEMDPSFNMEFFNTELREWIIPEIVDAYVKGDVETLSQWLSEAVCSNYVCLTLASLSMASRTKAIAGNGIETRWSSPRYKRSRHHDGKITPSIRDSSIRHLVPHTGDPRLPRYQNWRSQSRCGRPHPTGIPRTSPS
jgi:hypothetical protein